MRRIYTSSPNRIILVIVMGILLTVASLGCRAGDDPAPTPLPPAREGAFAVIELFTSEGCSSCPPADALLGEIVSDAQKGNLPIYCIAFHIDYWDGLGWKDRFSLTASTDRQRKYDQTLAAETYTPQMIVNGRKQFVGSDRDAARQAIVEAIGSPSAGRLSLKTMPATDGNLSISYQTSGTAPDSVLNLVLLERSASTDVPRGENAGQTLHHVNIARSIQTIPLSSATGQTTLKLPDDLPAKDALVIGYVQDPVSMQIVAAAKIDLAQ